MKVVATNREVSFKYEVLETYNCGIVLKGTEVKSIREGKVNLKDGFAIVKDGEIILKNVYIAPYDKASYNNVPDLRDRVLLLRKDEIIKIVGKVKIGGYTLIPRYMGFDGRLVKVTLALCRGKKIYDKREDAKKKEAIKKINIAKKI